MIDKSINAQIDQMVSTAPTDGVEPSFDQPDQTFPEDSVFTGESVQVAGKLSGLKDIIKGVVKDGAATKKVLERTPQPKQSVVVKPSATQELKELSTGAEISGIGTREEAKKAGKIQQKINQEPTVTPEQLQTSIDENIKVIEESKPEELTTAKQQFNLPLISDSTELQSAVKSITDNAGIKTENITFEDVIASAKKAGMDETFISNLTEGKLVVDPKNTYLALEAQKSSADHLTELMRKINDNPADVTPAQELEAIQTIAFHSLIQRSVKGYQTNVAQSLAVMRIPREGFIDLESASGGLMNSSKLREFASKFMDENLDAAGRAKLIDTTSKNGWGDKAMSVWINGILSRPATHIKNAISNSLMIPVRMGEKVGAAAIGTARKAVGLGEDEQYYFSELYSQLSGGIQAVKDGAKMASFAFKEGYPSTITDPTRIALGKARTEIFDYKADNPFALAIKGFNFVTTLPGRALLTSDEFFKGMNYRFELEALATRNGIKAMDDATKAGKSADEASKIFDDAVSNVYDNPPDELLALSQEATFTKPMEGFIKKAQDMVNDPSPLGFALKVNIPFISTPVNLNLQLLERTPLALLSKRIRSDIAAGGKEGDMALTKIGMGTGFAFVMSDAASNGSITGQGPADRGQKDAMVRQGWQPYSIVYNFDNISEEQKASFAKLPVDVRYGTGDYQGKVFISYQGMEPIGAFMAMAANYNEFVRYEDDNSKVSTQAAALAYGFYDYMMDSPFLQGISNIASTFDGRYGSDQDKTVGMLQKLEAAFVKFGAKAVTPLSGLVSSGREKLDPYQRDYKVDPNEDSMIPAGIIQGMNQVMNDTPGLSDKLPLKLNLWGEPIQHEYTWSPVRMKAGQQGEADQIIIQTGAKIGMPDRNISHVVEKGLSVSTTLSPLEYNRMLEIANDAAGLNLQQRIIDVAPDIQSLPLYKQQSIIKSIVEETFTKARDILYRESPEIQQRIQDRADIIRDKGLGAK